MKKKSKREISATEQPSRETLIDRWSKDLLRMKTFMRLRQQLQANNCWLANKGTRRYDNDKLD